MTSDVINFSEYQRRKETRSSGPSWRLYSSPFSRTPVPIVRISQLMLDAPEDPALVKLAWLLSYFGEIPLPDGKTYRLERGRLEVKDNAGWVPSEVSFNELAHLASGLSRPQWQQIVARCRPKRAVFRLDEFFQSLVPPEA